MITLITGTPGAGKTAWIVQEITRLPSQRKLFVHGIPGLIPAHEVVYCKSLLCDLCAAVEESEKRYYLEDWPTWATDGSLIIADEVQRIWSIKNSAAAASDDISRLQTHRHRGLDFWLIAQSPKLLNTGVRAVTGRHIHLVSKWNGRSEYEWPEIKEDCSSRGDAVIRLYKLPKQIFTLYKSASLHTKITHRKPMSFYAMIFAVFVIIGLFYLVYTRLQNRLVPVDVEKSTSATVPAGSDAAIAANLLGVTAAEKTVIDRADYLRSEKPLIHGKPETAPVYSALVEVVDFPRINGCVRSTSNENPFCNCYSQQGSIIEIDEEICIKYVRHLPFNRFKKPKNVDDNGQSTDGIYAKNNDRL